MRLPAPDRGRGPGRRVRVERRRRTATRDGRRSPRRGGGNAGDHQRVTVAIVVVGQHVDGDRGVLVGGGAVVHRLDRVIGGGRFSGEPGDHVHDQVDGAGV